MTLNIVISDKSWETGQTGRVTLFVCRNNRSSGPKERGERAAKVPSPRWRLEAKTYFPYQSYRHVIKNTLEKNNFFLKKSTAGILSDHRRPTSICIIVFPLLPATPIFLIVSTRWVKPGLPVPALLKTSTTFSLLPSKIFISFTASMTELFFVRVKFNDRRAVRTFINDSLLPASRVEFNRRVIFRIAEELIFRAAANQYRLYGQF